MSFFNLNKQQRAELGESNRDNPNAWRRPAPFLIVLGFVMLLVVACVLNALGSKANAATAEMAVQPAVHAKANIKASGWIGASCGNHHLMRVDNKGKQEFGAEAVNSTTGKVKPFTVAPHTTKFVGVKAKAGDTLYLHGPLESTLYGPSTVPAPCSQYKANAKTDCTTGTATVTYTNRSSEKVFVNSYVSTATGSLPPLQLIKLKPGATKVQYIGGLSTGMFMGLGITDNAGTHLVNYFVVKC
jgi:hypothetical protein